MSPDCTRSARFRMSVAVVDKLATECCFLLPVFLPLSCSSHLLPYCATVDACLLRGLTSGKTPLAVHRALCAWVAERRDCSHFFAAGVLSTLLDTTSAGEGYYIFFKEFVSLEGSVCPLKVREELEGEGRTCG